MFLTLEGIEGAGKSTQATRLANRLQSLGCTVRLTREPGGTPLAAAIRAVLLHPEASLRALALADLADAEEPVEPLLPVTEVLLLSAARAQHVARMRVWLAQGDVVVSDRYSDATRAYQGAARGVDAGLIATLEVIATQGLRPDLTLLLDLPAAEGLRRKEAGRAGGGEWNRIDSEALDFHERVGAGYRALAAAEPSRFVVVDATVAADVLADAIWSVVIARLPEAHRVDASRSPGDRTEAPQPSGGADGPGPQ